MGFCFLNLTDAERAALVKVLLDRIAQIHARRGGEGGGT